MRRGKTSWCVLSWCLVLPSGILAQTVPGLAEQESAAGESGSAAHPRVSNGKALPSWLRLGGELRGRAEFTVDTVQDRDERLYLNRLRFHVAVEPAPWARLVFEGQDARAYSLRSGLRFEEQHDSLDVRRGYAELGQPEAGWRLRAGRQEVAVGDERLVGADTDWGAFGQTFDALRLSFAHEAWHLDAFTGFRVEPTRRRPDRADRTNRVSGVTLRLHTGPGGGVLEPYFLWKRGGDTVDLMQHRGHRDVVALGLRLQGDLPRSLDYIVEMAAERGHVVGDRVSAWAGHWEVGWMPLGKERGPRLGFEYNVASGDGDPEDGWHHSFDDLYPAGFNQYGISDPFAWRNIRYPGVSADIPLTRRWTLYGGWRSYWLATIQDGLYPGGDKYLVRNPAATSSHIGSQVFFSAGYARSARWQVHAGYGHLWEGRFLCQSGYRSALTTIYLLSSFRF